MADWNTPTVTSTYANVISYLNDRDLDATTMHGAGTATNIPTGAMKWNTSTNLLARYSGGSFGTVLLSQAGGGTGYATLNAALDGVFGSTRGQFLLRGAAVWAVYALGTSEYVLKSNGTDLVYGQVNLAGVGVTGTLPVTLGGTGGATQATARTGLGLGGLAILNAVTSAEIGTNAVVTAGISNDAVTTAKILDANVTDAKLASGINGKGVRTVSASAPSGGANGDIWYQV